MQVVRRDRHGHAALPVQRRQQRGDVELIAQIERRGRLVEQQDVGRLRQRRGDDDALLLAAAERVERARLAGERCPWRRAPRARWRNRAGPSTSNRPRCGWRPISTISSAVYSKASSVSCGTTARRRAISRRLSRVERLAAERDGPRRSARACRSAAAAASSCPSRSDRECRRGRPARWSTVTSSTTSGVPGVIAERDVIGLQQRGLQRRRSGPGLG